MSEAEIRAFTVPTEVGANQYCFQLPKGTVIKRHDNVLQRFFNFFDYVQNDEVFVSVADIVGHRYF